MSKRVVVWAVWPLCGLTLALILCAVTLAALNHYDLWNVSFLIAVASAALVGALISFRQPRNLVGWFIAGHAFCFALGEFGRQYAIYGVLTSPGSLPAARWVIWPTYWIWYPGLIFIVVFLILYFPDGRLVSRRWRWVVWLTVFVSVVTTVLRMLLPDQGEAPGIPNPLGVEGLRALSQTLASQILGTVVPAGWILLGTISAVSLVVRFRHSRGEERQQIKWFTFAVVFTIAYFAASQFLLREFLPSVAGEILFVITLESLWVAIGVAILRYRLYDIDLIINRTLVYGVLTVVLAAVYFSGVVALQYVFRYITGQETQLAVVASTLVIAALFNPLRHRIQGSIDRLFYRTRYDAAKTLEAFGSRLRKQTDLDELSGDLMGVVRETMHPEHVSLWMMPASKLEKGEN